MIASGIETSVPTITVETVHVNDDVTVAIEIVVDANEAENDLTQAAWQSERLLSDFEVKIESKFFPPEGRTFLAQWGKFST